MSEKQIPNPNGDSPSQPNFPPSVHKRYNPEDLEYANPKTVGLIGEELSLLSQHPGVNKSILTGSGETEEGKRLFVISTEQVKAKMKSPTIDVLGHYSPNSRDNLGVESVPNFDVILRERVRPSYDLPAPEGRNQINELVDHYWVYDHPVEDTRATTYEPVIYRVSSMVTYIGQENPIDKVDSAEFELAQKSGTLHRLSETEAKDFLHSIQTVGVSNSGSTS